MKIQKGEYGYRDSNRKMRMMITGVLILAILGQLLARQLTDNQAAKNILTVMAILTVLPMANMASPLLASWKYKTPERGFYERVKAYEPGVLLLYDLIVTTKEDILPFDAVAVHPTGIFAFCSSGKVKTDRAEKAVNQLLSENKIPLTIRIMTGEPGFLRRLDTLKPADSCDKPEMAAYAAALMKSLSM